MSTYTYRYVEVLREMVDGVSWKKASLPDAKAHEGETYKITQYEIPEGESRYYRAEKGEWVPVDKVPVKWAPVKWYSYLPKNRVLDNKDPYYRPKYNEVTAKSGETFFVEEHLCWCNNGGYVRDEYISTHGFNDSPFSGRGLPSDVSDEVKEDIDKDYAYDHTWVTLDEWETAFETAKKAFEAKVRERYAAEMREDVMQKLDDIYKAIKDPAYTPKKSRKKKDDEEYCYEDTVEYLFEEDIWQLFHIQTEIDRIHFIVDDINDDFCVKGTRVIYYLA